ncbi:serine/threonine protein kinase [Saccharomycopsis crataegensis]|uniref:non-specific serine/threonine protein kinase n=1 Tax=Saccharomycopsis crataegensis TaxID=43959 RepID=A0AAV5QFE8_9ASCO|nr:serine/threonine protein kinase [Saccharomycopsis crataegensis]
MEHDNSYNPQFASPVEPGNRKRATTVASPTSRVPATPRMLKNASSRLSVNDPQKPQYVEIGSPPVPQTETLSGHDYSMPNYFPSPPQQYTTQNIFPLQEPPKSKNVPKLEPLNTQTANPVIDQKSQPYNPSEAQQQQQSRHQTNQSGSSKTSSPPNTNGNNHNHQHSSHRHGEQQQQQPPQFHRRAIGDWDFIRTIGAGSMGKVKEARHRRTQEICAVKIVPRAAKLYQRAHANDPPPADNAEHQKRMKEFEKEVARDKRTIREAALGKLLYHPYICRLYEMIPMTNHYYMLFEFVSGGQMLDYIVSHGSLRERHARKFARGIASSLDYCHRNNVVHRDLKIENIMISKTGDIKIIDFGLSNLFDYHKLLKTYCGSLYFAAPELLSAHPYIGPEVDVWSFGVVLFVLVCGKVPFDDQSVSVLHEKIKKGNVEYPSSLSQECVDLLSRMLVVNPKKRASLKEIINHPWMNKNYDSRPHSYVPYRIPLELPLNPEVLKEIEKLELGTVENTARELTKILGSPEYALCAQKWYEKNAKFTASGIPRSLQDYSDPHFPDPTNGIHPLISIYYLVDEMKKRQLAKEMAHQEQVTSPFQEKFSSSSHEQKQAELQAQMNPQEGHLRQQKLEGQESQRIAVDHGEQLQNVPEIRESPTTNSGYDKALGSPKQSQNLDEVLSFPEAAHTLRNNDDEILSTKKPGNLDIPPLSAVIPEQQLSPKRAKSINNGPSGDDENKGSGINGLFRRLSGHRRTGSKNNSQHQSYVPDSAVPPLPNLPNIISYNYDKAAAAAAARGNDGVSKNVDNGHTVESSSQPRLHKSGSLRLVGGTDEGIVNDMPKRGQRKPRAGHNRAVSASAATYAENSGPNNRSGKDTITSATDNSYDDAAMNETANNTDNINKFNYNGAPSSANKNGASTMRAKSVGHGRSKSIGYKKSTGFQEIVPPLPQINDNLYGELVHQNYGGEKQPLSEATIVERAKNAEPGSMPSIEFAKTLYLKGFFSVQTTSTKPPAVIRQSIINSLEKLGVDFLEVKGGFVCTFLNKKEQALTGSHNASTTNSNNTAVEGDNVITTKISTSNFSHNSSHSDTKDAVSSISTGSKGHRRKFSIGFKKQPATPKIPATPILFSPTSPNPNHSMDGESSASLESLSGIGASDMILSSRINQGKSGKPVQRNPIRFEISIVKIPILSLLGVQLKKLSGNAWAYKTLADHILTDLNL